MYLDPELINASLGRLTLLLHHLIVSNLAPSSSRLMICLFPQPKKLSKSLEGKDPMS